MISIKLYKDIDRDYLNYNGQEVVFSLEALQRILNENPQDNDLTIYIHSDGGNVHEGLAIYDALRTSGKNIYTHIDGNCHSMAIIILLAAPAAQRTANPNARALIHKVRAPYYGDGTADELETAAESIRKEQNAILDIYTERTGTPRDVLEAIMDKEEYQNMETMQALGFISGVSEYNTNKADKSAELRVRSSKTMPIQSSKLEGRSSKRNNGNSALIFITNNMKEKRFSVSEFLNKVGNFLNATDAKNYEHTDANGNVLFTTDAEDATLEVGMAATPDGEYELPEIGTVVIADGVITSIGETQEAAENEDEAQSEEAAAAAEKIAALEEENADLKKQIEELTAKLEEATDLLYEVKNHITSNYKPASRTTNAKLKESKAAYDMNVVRERRAAMLK